MGKSRSQISQQLVTLLLATGKLGGSSSAFESVVGVQSFLASGRTFPIAAVQTLDATIDPDVPGRFEVAHFRVSVAAGPITETPALNVASGGSASGQHLAENLIRDLLAAMNPTPSSSFVDSTHGFQGEVASISPDRPIVAVGATYVVAHFDVDVFNATRADT